jgi:hypothetical protein
VMSAAVRRVEAVPESGIGTGQDTSAQATRAGRGFRKVARCAQPFPFVTILFLK